MSLKEFDNTYSKRNMIKSPLRYPGGKNYAISYLKKLIPENTTKLISPFFGAGHFEIYCASKGIDVYGYDIFEPLVEFWQCLIEDSKKLADCVKDYYPFNLEDFYLIRQAHRYHPDKYERAAIYYALNKIAYMGGVFSSAPATDISDLRCYLSPLKIEKLGKLHIRNLTVQNMNFQKSISKCGDNDNTLLFCDPPYYDHQVSVEMYRGKRRYDPDPFDHGALFNLLNKKRKSKWILCYNNNEYIRELYSEYEIVPAEWKKSMGKRSFGGKGEKIDDIIILSK